MKQPINEIKRMQQLAGLIKEGHYHDMEVNKDLRTGQKMKDGSTVYDILDIKKDPELKQQIQVGDLVYNMYGDRWRVSKIDNDKVSLSTIGSPEFGAMDITV